MLKLYKIISDEQGNYKII